METSLARLRSARWYRRQFALSWPQFLTAGCTPRPTKCQNDWHRPLPQGRITLLPPIHLDSRGAKSMGTFQKLAIPLTAALLALMAQVALGDDWPQWRGPRQDGISRETGL